MAGRGVGVPLQEGQSVEGSTWSLRVEMLVAQELLCNLQSPVQNENVGLFAQNIIKGFKTATAEHLTKLLNQAWGPVQCTGHRPMKSALDAEDL